MATMLDTLNSMFRKVILLNELSGNLKFALRFSDPDGVRSGKSGWSFGIVQWDTQNNSTSLKCLAACGFTPLEIKGIVEQTFSLAKMKELGAKLAANADVIATYDTAQLSGCLNSALNVTTSHGLPVDNPTGILALADYVNQYGSIGPQFIAFIGGLDQPATAEDVLTFKLDHTAYGERCPGDCRRRYANLVKVVNGAKA